MTRPPSTYSSLSLSQTKKSATQWVSPEKARYVDIAVLAPLPNPLTYSIPESMQGILKRGARVIVPLGNRRLTGYVIAFRELPPKGLHLRDIIEILDETPLIDEAFLDLLLWTASYYIAPIGEIFRAALPSQFHRASRPGYALSAKGIEELRLRRERYTKGLEELSPDTMLLAVIERAKVLLCDAVDDPPLADALFTKGFLAKIPFLGAAKDKPSTEKLAEPTGAKPRRPLGSRQKEVMQALAKKSPVLIKELAAIIPGARSALKTLARAGLITISEREISRDPFLGPPRHVAIPALSAAQIAAIDAINQKVRQEEFRAFLLHGITGSGKTEVYLQTIAECDRLGKGAIVLVPEISLTPQLAGIFRGRFGEKVAILHSGLTDAERFEQWRKIQDGRRSIVVGARSAVFAPLKNLGIIVVDEEHDPSFKQEERLKYHGRDLALVRAKRACAVAILGSATPSLESHASNKLTRLLLPERPTPQPLPEVQIIDMRTWRNDLGDAMLSPPLLDAISTELRAKGQIILFLNRRGFSNFVVCEACGFTFSCKDCDVTLTHHRAKERLLCHYCGYSLPLASHCPACGDPSLAFVGVGTERIETRLREVFPEARVLRLDRDTSSIRDLEGMLRRFSQGEADILVGTQMVSKGHDFSGVSLVGVILADLSLRLPDFRAAERTFQLLVQVSGRAGRGTRPGRVLLQSFVPEHDAIQCAKDHDYLRFAALELDRRRTRLFPPYAYLAALRLDGPEFKGVHAAAELLRRRAISLAPRGVEVLGPAPAPLSRLKGRIRFQLLAKGTSRPVLRTFLKKLLQARTMIAPPVVLSVDIDPVSML